MTDTEVVRLAVIPGDGIGPEVVGATVPALRAALEALITGLRQQLDLAVNLRPVRASPGVPTTRCPTPWHHTADLGGNASTADVASAVLHTIESQG